MSELKARQTQVLILIGEITILMQKTEAMLKACLLLIFGGRDIEVPFKKVLNLDRKTLGALLMELREVKNVPENLDEILTELLEKRNLFVHSLFLQPWFDLSSEKGLNEMYAFCQSLLKVARSALPVFIAFGSSENATRKLNDRDAKLFDSIIWQIVKTAGPDFGGKSFEDYLKNFEKEIEAIKTTVYTNPDDKNVGDTFT